ncbi:MAG: 30S ribosomal protein S20 [Eubacteriales bacterium]|nr:30S ribosomal protein S20 [Eubacteriales bacterium]
MPNIKSAIKRVSNSQQKAKFNKHAKSSLRTAIKKGEKAIEEASDQAAKLVQETQIKLDKAVGKGLVHKNKAARKKSRLAKKLNEMTK